MRQQALLIVLLSISFSVIAENEAPPKPLDRPVQDLTTPAVEEGEPAAGKRVKQTIDKFKGTDVHHVLYLPTDWKKDKKYPVIIEYAGNKFREGPGTVEACNLGYGLSAGKKFIWVCAPYVSKDHQSNQVTWWGDIDATVEYCKTVVADICNNYGGDPAAVFVSGFSRGAIACNYIGLHDDEIAALWRGFICFSHYDGIREWNYPESGRAAAAVRLKRLKGRPQFICAEDDSVYEVQDYLKEAYPQGDFTFCKVSGWDHSDTWVLYDKPARKAVRQWFMDGLEKDNRQKAGKHNACSDSD